MNQFIIIIIIIIFYFRRPSFIWALVNCQNSLIVERTPTKKLQHIITRISVGVRFIIYSSVSFKNTLPNKSEREAIRYVIYVWKSSFIDMVHCGVICNRMWERERERERESSERGILTRIWSQPHLRCRESLRFVNTKIQTLLSSLSHEPQLGCPFLFPLFYSQHFAHSNTITFHITIIITTWKKECLARKRPDFEREREISTFW